MKVLVATGCTSGLGLSALSQLLATSTEPYLMILGSRTTPPTQALRALASSQNEQKHVIHDLPLELSDLKSVATFAGEVRIIVESEGNGSIDLLLLNAGMYQRDFKVIDECGGWCEEAVVNHFSQHYLTLLLEPLLTPKTEALPTQIPKIVIVSSSKHTSISSLASLKPMLRDPTRPTKTLERYSASKFVQLVGAHWWRERLAGKVEVVAVSPGFVPTTGLNRDESFLGRFFLQNILYWAPFCTILKDGGKAILNAVTFPSASLSIAVSFPYLNKSGELIDVDSRIAEGGKSLESEWCLTREVLEG